MNPELQKVLSQQNRDEAADFMTKILHVALDFKLQTNVRKRLSSNDELQRSIVKSLNKEGQEYYGILDEFVRQILPDCTNFSSANFMGFPDSGNSIAGLGASILTELLQQNLINQSICAPSATFVEITVLQWLRDALGFHNSPASSVWDVGGIITPGGTSSNAIAMMLARENKDKSTMESGVRDPGKYKIVIPKGIGHYSIKSSQRWLGCGNNLIEVDTKNFRYDVAALEKALKENAGSIMALVAYAGDSRTMTVDNFGEIAQVAKSLAPDVWLHADACHGFSLSFSNRLKSKLAGIELFDSISLDPHKVMLVPYTLSALLVRDPFEMKKIASVSDLIMQEDFAFGQITPFVGSKPWLSLRLWFMMKSFGSIGLEKLVDQRHASALKFHELISQNPRFRPINDVDINSVAFVYVGSYGSDLERINHTTKAIYARIVKEGRFHLHQFSVPDAGVFEEGRTIYPLRYMSGNPLIEVADMRNLIDYAEKIGAEIEGGSNE